MPTLEWIEKKEVEAHHLVVPTRLLEPVSKLSQDSEDGNLIVEFPVQTSTSIFSVATNMAMSLLREVSREKSV